MLLPNLELGWADLRDRHYWELLFAVRIAMYMLLLRYVFEKFIFALIGTILGIQNIQRNPVLKKAYQPSKQWSRDEISGSSKQLDTNPDNDVLDKFTETGWKWTYYTSSTIGGCLVLWNKPWVWDIRQCWVDYSNQTVPSDIWWYFMITLGFWLSRVVWLPFDVRRKDDFLMYIHNITAVVILTLCWYIQAFRMFSVAVLVSDCNEIFFKGGKLLKYLKCQRGYDIDFVLFTVVWMVTRWAVFPFWIVRSYMVDLPEVVPSVTSFLFYYVGLGLMCMLIFLDVLWTYYVWEMCLEFYRSGHVPQDARSDVEEEE